MSGICPVCVVLRMIVMSKLIVTFFVNSLFDVKFCFQMEIPSICNWKTTCYNVTENEYQD